MKNRRQIRSKINMISKGIKALNNHLEARATPEDQEHLHVLNVNDQTPRSEVHLRRTELKHMIAALNWVLE